MRETPGGEGSSTTPSVRRAELPAGSLLGHYVASGAFADCYTTELPGPVSHAQFVEAFYTTSLFKLERLLLSLIIARPSTDAQAAQLAHGQASSFAAWSVEARAENQLLLAAGRTRSWLMVVPSSANATQLFFGSAVVPGQQTAGRPASMGLVFNTLLGFHKLYSRALLRSARTRLSRQGIGGELGATSGGPRDPP